MYSCLGNRRIHGNIIVGEEHMSDTGNAFYWFDWQAISAAGHRAYGKYVFCHLLLYYSSSRGGDWGSRFISDGDFLPSQQLSVPSDGSETQTKVLSAVSDARDHCYVVAVHSMGEPTLDEVDKALRKDEVRGYLGMTSCNGSFEQLIQLSHKMNLVPACNVRHGTFEKEDGFSYLSDAELTQMGYREIAQA